ncbi:S-type pyocin family protein [Brevundimonas sp.]|uniref:S-type pyocin family protein n=1 Tax=Brevundimonas sp. TaxID=1871086 RepID=UPI0025EDD57A|nr:S-type pyocin family protein [Brevundimonas sp.]
MRIRQAAAIAVTGIWLAACGNGGSAVETRDREAEAASAEGAAVDASAPTPAAGGGREAARGAPIWSSTRRYTAEQNAQRAFERNGQAFGAADVDAYVRQAHAFISSPPPGTETVRRRNGDTLFYHAASNTFAVATADGAPRTMFKPDDGAAYWAQQQASLDRGDGEG